MVIYLELGADLRMTQLLPLPLNVSCFSKIQIGFTFLAPAHPGSQEKGRLTGVCVCIVSKWDQTNDIHLSYPLKQYPLRKV